jgi:hypothetical protein
VVGMPALIGVGQHRGRLFAAQPWHDPAHQPGEVEKRVFIGNAERCCRADSVRLACFRRRAQFGSPRRAVLGESRKAVGARIGAVARRAVGHMQQQRIAEPAQLRADRERLVIRMSDDDHDPRADRTIAGQLREQRCCRALLGHGGDAANAGFGP